MIGVLAILVAVAFWFVVGLALHTIVNGVRGELRARGHVNHWSDAYDPRTAGRTRQRQALYEEHLGPDADLRNHWSTGPYGYGPHGDL